MINHVVLFKLKEFGTIEEKEGVLNQFRNKLLDLKRQIPELKYIEVGQNYQLQTTSFDLCLISHFETIAELDRYRVHPEHKKVIEFVNEIAINRAAVDFEF